MKKILERAKEYIDGVKITDIPSEVLLKNGYINGAIDQREIDIQRACEWLVANGYFLVGHREIKDFKQAMKGEE